MTTVDVPNDYLILIGHLCLSGNMWLGMALIMDTKKGKNFRKIKIHDFKRDRTTCSEYEKSL